MAEEDCDHQTRPLMEIHSHSHSHQPETNLALVGQSSDESNYGEDLVHLRDHIASSPVIMCGVFRHLAPADKRSAALVCRRWRTLLEQSCYWTWAETRMSRRDFAQKFKSPRVRNIGSVRLDVSEVQIRKFFSSVQDFRMTKLDVGYVNLSSISPLVLSGLVTSLEELKLCLCRLQPEQVTSIFTAASETDRLRLRSLSINFTDLSSVPASLLSQAVVRLVTVNLWLCRLSAGQVQTIFKTISDTPDLTLRNLTLNPTDFSVVPANILSKAILRLETVNLNYTELSPEQLRSLCEDVAASKDLKLRTLQLSSTSLASVSGDCLARAVVRLERADLYNTSLSPHQLEAVFNTILHTPDLRLTSLHIGGNGLSFLCPAVLSQAILRLQEVKLKDTRLTQDQVNAVFRTFVESQGETERCLHIGGKEFATVSEEILSLAGNKLAHCDLSKTWYLKG